MDFSFTEEQTLLRNSLSRYLADNYDFEAWRKFTRTREGRDPAHWRQFAELGLFAAPLPEEHGGLGGGPVDSMIVMEEFGRALVVEPFVPTVVIGGGLLAKTGGAAAEENGCPRSPAAKPSWRSPLPSPRAATISPTSPPPRRKQGDGYVLNGQKSVVLGAPWADHADRHRPHRRQPARKQGVSVFLVERAAKGVARARLCGDERVARQRDQFREQRRRG